MAPAPQIAEAAANFDMKINEHSEDGIIYVRECDMALPPQMPEAAAAFDIKISDHKMVLYMV